jgi:hypothetical protein
MEQLVLQNKPYNSRHKLEMCTLQHSLLSTGIIWFRLYISTNVSITIINY